MKIFEFRWENEKIRKREEGQENILEEESIIFRGSQPVTPENLFDNPQKNVSIHFTHNKFTFHIKINYNPLSNEEKIPKDHISFNNLSKHYWLFNSNVSFDIQITDWRKKTGKNFHLKLKEINSKRNFLTATKKLHRYWFPVNKTQEPKKN